MFISPQNRQLQSLSLGEWEKWAPKKVEDNDDFFYTVEDDQQLLSAIEMIKEDLSGEGKSFYHLAALRSWN